MYLNCHTVFSFKYGTLPVKMLLQEAQRCGIKKLALTEVNNTSSYIEMLRLNQSLDEKDRLQFFLGVEFRQENQLCFIALAKNNAGFEEINRFLSYHNREEIKLPERAPEFENVFVLYPFGKFDPAALHAWEFVAVRKHQLTQHVLNKSRQTHPHKFAALHPVTFATKSDFNTHRLLRAIDNNMLLSKLPEHFQAKADEIMMPEAELVKMFEQCPELIDNARQLLEYCSIELDLYTDKNKKYYSGSKSSDWDLLVSSAKIGFEKKYDANNPVLIERFERELRIIKQKNFAAYYLIAYDLVNFARNNDYDYVGRGSGANSLIAYCLGITNVDPIELDLYFERFLNPERTSPPDFDLDFAWDNRDEIYHYLFEKYGQEHVCLLGTHVTYQKRSVLRELGKVFGLPKNEIDALVDEPEKNKNKDHISELIFKYAERIKDLPANISIHAGGVLITEKPIYAYTALEMPPKGLPVSHFEMHNAEDIGIYKFDILSQRGLGHIKESVKRIKQNQGIDIDIYRFHDFKHDEKVKELLRSGNTMGCFYVESPAMRMLLAKLQCQDYLTLVAASSIIRPGVARSGMMRAYIERFHLTQRGEKYESIHPLMDELMKETYGVMVYQEDVIKVAHHFGGLTLTEADVLRRGMSGKYRSREEFKKVEDKFFSNCKEKDYPQHVVERIWFEIESFSGYSFAKGHSASYAVESYQSLYLKAHYPLEFMVGVINNFGGFYATEFYFHEARMQGAKIKAPCVNKSEYLSTIYKDEIYIGFIHLKGLETKVAKLIDLERTRNGLYKSLHDFLNRNDLGLEQLRLLIRIGAFGFTNKSKQNLLWEAMLYFSNTKSKSKSSMEIFQDDSPESQLPQLERNSFDDAFDEMELLGFPLCDPFLLLDTNERGDTTADLLKSKTGKQVNLIGYVVTIKNTGTLKGELMHFGTFYDYDGKVFDTVHFPDVAKKFPFRGRGFYKIKGKVVEDFGVPMVEVSKMERLAFVNKKQSGV
jgi:DNA-directed DNA polymerase III PolC